MRTDEGEPSNRIYIKTVKELQRIIRDDFREGGWLPGGREMAQRLGVGHSTYTKAVSSLESNGCVVGYPRKGYYVTPIRERIHKIGLILGNGELFPFVQRAEALADCIRSFNRFGYDVQFINGTRPEQLSENCVALGVDGVVWLFPREGSQLHMDAFSKECDLPTIAVCPLQIAMPHKMPCIYRDFAEIATMQAKGIAARGHKSVVVASYPERIWTETMMSVLQRAGIAAEFYPVQHCHYQLDFCSVLRKTGASCLISGGPEPIFIKIFDAVSNLPAAQRPELMLSETEPSRRAAIVPHNLPCFYIEESVMMGEAAAKAVIEGLRTGASVEGIRVTLQSTEWTRCGSITRST